MEGQHDSEFSKPQSSSPNPACGWDTRFHERSCAGGNKAKAGRIRRTNSSSFLASPGLQVPGWKEIESKVVISNDVLNWRIFPLNGWQLNIMWWDFFTEFFVIELGICQNANDPCSSGLSSERVTGISFNAFH